MIDAHKEIFIDTSGWLALEDASDPANSMTTQESRRLLQEGFHYVTTNFVLDEVYTVLKFRIGHAAAVRFGEKVRASSLVAVLIVSPAMEDEAWRFFEHQPQSTASYTDFVSWAVMRKRGIQVALTSDANFTAAGFEVLPRSLGNRLLDEPPPGCADLGQ
ncbi:MAG: type II toxin-antitoxin system VapC family toxin [Candidatus Wallbacteria bacterium]|nr:type II toxin-antitoxin system VapC family toxin [Candidatus Wallbacteria bacterium]